MTDQPRRSILVVPGSSPRFLAKALSSPADAVILDLEDSVAPEGRAAARQNIIAALGAPGWGRQLRAVRVSATSSPWFYGDLIAIVEAAGAQLDAVVLPKVNEPGDVYMLATLLAQIEALHGIVRPIAIEAQIETARGLAQVEQIAASSRRLASLIFGPGDFAAALGMPVLGIGELGGAYPGHLWHAALSRLIVAARAADLQAIDGPYGNLDDAAGLVTSAQNARWLGYDGKWAIHPSQIAPITAVFTPTAAEVVAAQQIVAAYERSVAGGQGALRHGAEMLDAASVAMARRCLARAAPPA